MTNEAHVSNGMCGQVLRFVGRRAGPSGIQRVRELAGETRTVAELEDLSAWTSWDRAKALLEAASSVLGGSHVLREVATDWVRSVDSSGEVVSLRKALGSAEEILRLIEVIALKFCSVVRMEPVEVHESWGVVTADSVPEFPRYQEFCDFTAGLLSVGPILFGHPPALVEETECELRGDSRCRYRVEWTAKSNDPAVESEYLRQELAALLTRFESFKSTVRDLVSGHDVETLLGRITDQAAMAVRAPAYVLVVRPDPGGPPRIHHSGLAEAELAGVVDDLLGGVADDADPSRLVVDVASDRRHYGWLAALFPAGPGFLPDERSLFTMYAELAAAALDSATGLELAHRDHATASALLELSSALAVVSSSSEAAERLVQALPKVVSCDRGSIFLFDQATVTLTCAALHGLEPAAAEALRGMTISTTDTPALGRMLEEPVPMFFEIDSPDPFIRGYLEVTGGCAMVVVPLVHRGRFYGVLTAGVDDRPERLGNHPDLIVRLNGLAHQGAGALHNAELVGQIRRQALHDPLTGLPNRTLFEERARHLLAQAKRRHSHVGLLFVDLDRFKHVNDTYGHAAGDELIKLVASRLGGCLRTSDTLARLGGDEFAVLLSDVDGPIDGGAVARRLISATRRPFVVSHHRLAISCSIGIAYDCDGGVDYEDLLRRADAAMYEAKASGRDAYAFAPAPALT
ncbi:MAG: hypothetical protein QOJ09_2806 [Actinomycetota bacterium]|nr:hypothetical protein [Actinomycetota bacterium]